MARVLTPIKNTHTQVASPLQGPPLRGEVHLFGSLNVAFVGQLEGGGGGGAACQHEGLFRSLRINPVLQLSHVIITIIRGNWSMEMTKALLINLELMLERSLRRLSYT